MQDREAYEKWYVLLAHINIIYAQTGFFVKTTSFSMQDFEYSSNLLRRVAVQIFRADHQISRSFFHPTNIQNPAWFVRRDRFRGPTHEQWWISRMITSRGGFACTERDRRTGMRTETVKNMISRYFCCVFFTTGRTIFFSGMRRTALWRLQGREFKISRKHKFFREQRHTGTANCGIWITCFNWRKTCFL